MSYCRWSSDDYQCDVYVWEDVDGGWRTEVAGRRWEFNWLPAPIKCDPFDKAKFHAWCERNREVMRLMDDPNGGHWVDVPEPDGGRTRWNETPGECADDLEHLRSIGLNVPQYAIDALREEQAEMDAR